MYSLKQIAIKQNLEYVILGARQRLRECSYFDCLNTSTCPFFADILSSAKRIADENGVILGKEDDFND